MTIAPPSPWHEIVAVLFGVGTGLTLDEFALWLDLKDVYWSEQGRRSIDAVIVAATFTGMVLVGYHRVGRVATEVEDVVFAIVGAFGVLAIVVAVVNLAKEKFGMAVVGLFILPVGLVGAFRLGKPHSLWARVFYRERKKARARARFGDSVSDDCGSAGRRRSVRRRLSGSACRARRRRGAGVAALAPPLQPLVDQHADRGGRRDRKQRSENAGKLPADEDRDDRHRRVDPDGVLVEQRLNHSILNLLVDDEENEPGDRAPGKPWKAATIATRKPPTVKPISGTRSQNPTITPMVTANSTPRSSRDAHVKTPAAIASSRLTET